MARKPRKTTTDKEAYDVVTMSLPVNVVAEVRRRYESEDQPPSIFLRRLIVAGLGPFNPVDSQSARAGRTASQGALAIAGSTSAKRRNAPAWSACSVLRTFSDSSSDHAAAQPRPPSPRPLQPPTPTSPRIDRFSASDHRRRRYAPVITSCRISSQSQTTSLTTYIITMGEWKIPHFIRRWQPGSYGKIGIQHACLVASEGASFSTSSQQVLAWEYR